MEEIQELVNLTGNSTSDYKLINLKLTELISEKVEQIEDVFKEMNSKITQNKQMEDFLVQLDCKYNFEPQQKEDSVLAINEIGGADRADCRRRLEPDEAGARLDKRLENENLILNELMGLSSGLTVSEFSKVKVARINEEEHIQVIEVRFSKQFKEELRAEFESRFLVMP